MTEASPLSVAFVERKPEVAAQVLDNLPSEDAAAFIDTLPGRISGRALGEMSPLGAAQCLALLEPDRAANVLRAMMFQDGASVVRVMDDNTRAAVMEALPGDLARDFEKSLSHPRDSVGAWMDQRNSPLPQTRTVADALKYAKRKRRPNGDEVFVVDGARRYVGVARISELVQSDPKAVLKDVIIRDTPALSNRATLASVVNAPDWDKFTHLAVTGRKGNFLGTLSRAQARVGLAAARRRPINLTPNSVLTHLIASFFVSFVGLLGLVLHSADIQPNTSPGEPS